MGTTLVVNPDGSGFLVGNIYRCFLYTVTLAMAFSIITLEKTLWKHSFNILVYVYNYKTANDMLVVCVHFFFYIFMTEKIAICDCR